MFIRCMPDSHGGQKGVSDFLKLVSWVAVSHHVSAGNQTFFSQGFKQFQMLLTTEPSLRPPMQHLFNFFFSRLFCNTNTFLSFSRGKECKVKEGSNLLKGTQLESKLFLMQFFLMVKRRRKRREDGNQGKKGQERREQGSKDRGREELWFWRSHADCHCLAPLFSWTLDFPMIQLAGLLPSCCCYWTKYIPSSNIICSLYFFKSDILSMISGEGCV